MLARRTLPLVVAIVLTAATVAAALLGAAADRDTANAARRHALEQTTVAASTFGKSLEARVVDVAGLFDASQHVSAEEFSAFTEPMLADSHAAELSYVQLRPLTQRAPRRAVVEFTKTVDDDTALLGTDLLASTPDAEAIATAERTRSPQSTVPMPLGDDPADLGVRLFVPVYGRDAGPTADRVAIGLVAATFSFRDLSPLLTPLIPSGAQIQMHVSGTPPVAQPLLDGPVSRANVDIAGRTWEFTVASPPTTRPVFGLSRGQAAALVLGLLTILITLLTRQAVVAARRSDEVAALRQRERDQAVRARELTQAAASELLAHLPDLAVLRVDRDLRIVDASGGLFARAGWSLDEIDGKPLVETFGARGERLAAPVLRALHGEASAFSFNGIRASDNRYWMQALPLPGNDDEVLLVASDVTALMGAESARAEAQARFERLFESAPVGMALVNTKGKFVHVNDAMAEITGFTRDALLQMGPPNVTHPDDIQVTQQQVKGLLTGELPRLSVEKRYLHASGRTVWVSLNATVLHDVEGQPEYILAHILDVTERHDFEERLQHLANHDPLTDLRNRRSFEEALQTQVACARRYGDRAALLMIDLDHFKLLNDGLGHQVGDVALTGAADVFRRALRDSDTVGRLGGDEFAVILPKADEPGAARVAGKLADEIRALGVRLAVDHDQDPAAPTISGSIGVAMLDGRHRTIDEALVDADRALYAAKAAGRDRFAVAPALQHDIV